MLPFFENGYDKTYYKYFCRGIFKDEGEEEIKVLLNLKNFLTQIFIYKIVCQEIGYKKR